MLLGSFWSPGGSIWVGWDGILAPVVGPGPPKLPFRVIDPILKPILQFVFPPGPPFWGSFWVTFWCFLGFCRDVVLGSVFGSPPDLVFGGFGYSLRRFFDGFRNDVGSKVRK